MKKILLAAMLMVGCATVQAQQNPYDYQEMSSCPSKMDEEQQLSGTVRCRAMCSSYGRDFAEYSADCKCWCKPDGRTHGHGGYSVPNQNGYPNQT